MKTMEITIPDGLTEYLQSQATKHGYASSKDYLQSVLTDLESRINDKKEFEAALLDAIRSPDVVADAAFWAARRQKILASCHLSHSK
jgi:Arc/MetJ-type ribon-helix-helix transcriptional regulator